MPTHYHKCDDCGTTKSITHLIADAPIWPVCCDQVMPRLSNLRRRPTTAFHKPIEMLSLALNNEHEIAYFRQRNPTADISNDRNSPVFGVPLAHTREEKLRILRNEGFEELN